MAYKDLADWLIRGHKVSERTAYRKIKAARLSNAVPGLLEKIEAGELSVTKVAQVQSAIQIHEKHSRERISVEHKSEILAKVEKLGARETEQTLMTYFPELMSEARQTRTTVITPDISRLALNLPNETLNLIKRAQELLSHSIPNGSQAEVIRRVFEDFLDRKDPLRKKEKSKPAEAPASTQSAGTCRSAAAQSLSGAAVRRDVFRKAEGKCQFVDHKTKTVCGSTYQVQSDHIKPKAIGGTNKPSNYRALCRRHNLYMAEVNLGSKATDWRRRR